VSSSPTSTTLVDVTMPQMGVSVAEGTVVEWKKQPGDWVQADETICEISTDKIDTEVPSPAAGRLTEILVEVGATVEVGAVLARLNRLAKTVPPDAPWTAKRASQWDGRTFEDWSRRKIRTAAAREMLRLAIEGVWAAEPRDVSMLHVLFYIRSAGCFDYLVDTEGGAQQDRFVGGSQLIAILIAQELPRENVLLGAPVRKLQRADHGVTVHADGATVRARRAIVATAPPLAGRIAYDPPLPGHRDQLTQRMPLGTVAKCMAVYERPFWREVGLTGQATSDTGPLKLTFDNSPPSGTPGVLLGFLEGEPGRRASLLLRRHQVEAVLADAAAYFGPRAA